MVERLKIGVWLRRASITLVVGWLAFTLGVAPYFLAGFATQGRFDRQDRRNEGLTPGSFDLAFEEIELRAADGVTLSGWSVPAAEPKGNVILVHGLNRRRIEMVKKLPFLNEAGWNAVLFDLRHHGESGGESRTYGFYERLDVAAATAWARERSPGPVVLWGVSMGAASATLAAAADSEVAGLVCDSSYRSLSDTLRHHLAMGRGFRWWMRTVPSWPTAEILLYWIGKRGGFDPSAIDIVAAARKLEGRPCLFVCNSNDRRMPSEIAFELQAAAGPQAKVLVVPGDSHGGAYREGTAAYQHAVEEVLNEVLESERRKAEVVEAALP